MKNHDVGGKGLKPVPIGPHQLSLTQSQIGTAWTTGTTLTTKVSGVRKDRR